VGLLKSRSLRKLLMLALLFGLMLGVHNRLTRSDVLAIETVQIEGEFRYLSKQHLKENALPHVSGGFFSVNLERIRNRLLELPWVEDASIRRQWPNALNIRVMEKKPVAYWGDKQLLSSKAVLFEPETADANMGLPKLSGPLGQHRNMLMELGRMQAWLADTGLSISRVNQDERRSWTLVMTSGMELRLGRKYQHERLLRFVEVFTGKLMKKKQNIKHIDMRYTNGLAVAWKKTTRDQGA
jgi:cell division protein FtsQ